MNQELAKAILNFDEDFPGEEDATIEVPASVWLDWINMATIILENNE